MAEVGPGHYRAGACAYESTSGERGGRGMMTKMMMHAAGLCLCYFTVHPEIVNSGF